MNKAYDYKKYLQEQVEMANADAYNPDYKEKIKIIIICYGDTPVGPDPMRTGDFIEYNWNGITFRGYVFVIDPKSSSFMDIL